MPSLKTFTYNDSNPRKKKIFIAWILRGYILDESGRITAPLIRWVTQLNTHTLKNAVKGVYTTGTFMPSFMNIRR
jgi:hypothetical protein